MKAKFLSLAAVAVLFASCSGDDNGGGVSEEKLLGKWYPVSYSYMGQTVPYTDHEDCGKDYTEFLAGGALNDVDVWDCENYTDEGTWALDGKNLTVTIEGEVTNAKVKTLNGSTLKVEEQWDMDEDGTPEATVTMTFSRN